MTDGWTPLFDRLADEFDEVVPYFRRVGSWLVELLDPAAGTRLLDVGAGRGAVAVPAAVRGCAVTAIDGAARMVELLAAEHPEIDTRVMDAHALDLPDDSYDLATGGCVIHLISEPRRMLAELRRVVRPGGTVALTIPRIRFEGARWRVFTAIVEEYESRQTRPAPRPMVVDVPALLRATGFTDVRTSAVELRLPVADPETFWRFQMSHGFAARVEALRPADAAELRDRVIAELARSHAAGGIVLDRGAAAFIASVPR